MRQAWPSPLVWVLVSGASGGGCGGRGSHAIFQRSNPQQIQTNTATHLPPSGCREPIPVHACSQGCTHAVPHRCNDPAIHMHLLHAAYATRETREASGAHEPHSQSGRSTYTYSVFCHSQSLSSVGSLLSSMYQRLLVTTNFTRCAHTL